MLYRLRKEDSFVILISANCDCNSVTYVFDSRFVAIKTYLDFAESGILPVSKKMKTISFYFWNHIKSQQKFKFNTKLCAININLSNPVLSSEKIG